MGIWAGLSDSLRLVARAGSQAPGTPIGLNFATLDKPYMNSLGQVAFHGTIQGDGVDITNDSGLWATDPGGRLLLIARTNGTFDIGGGQMKTISYLALQGTPSGESQLKFNESGELAFFAAFTDGSSGIFVATIPEPHSAIYVGLGLVGCLFVRRQKTDRSRLSGEQD
jgi:hypothetical protein